MKIIVDRARCEGHGLCEDVAPDLFSLDDDGELVVAHEGDELPEQSETAARAAVSSCPVAALRATP
ncbi:ferredoxin [Modestobacter sp. I12A-02628]|uniref:Ferredoxin n=1 Tax=Goekera deserti TaxID=2497753 RepID=A0A7K3WI34_9ACTN|nr:ferredoxin [Goekera deserti]MPR00022.1 ferredoxin [Goekera deserti]NDI49801.1 ferredoxin [Goekera deserti]NEL55163.1 ferredoxin [Goekera deserti]